MITLALQILGWLVAIVAILVSVIFILYKRQFQYWEKLNVVYKPPSIPFGNFAEANFQKSPGQVLEDLYNEYRHEPYFGIFSFFKPQLVVNDPELIKHVFVSDFISFHDRGIYVNEVDDPLAAHLFSISGSSWRNLRVKLTPTFTSGKMKMMFPTLVEVGKKLQIYLEKPANAEEVLEIKDVMARFSTDIISSVAFGLETNSLDNPDCEFRQMGRKIFEVTPLEALRTGLSFTLPEVAKFFKMRQTKKEVEKFFMAAVKETIDFREKNNIKRNDFMQLIIQLKNKGYVDDADLLRDHGQKLTEHQDSNNQKFTFNEAAAQAFVFFVAGFETSSTTMQFAFYELARNQDIQDKLRQEIDKVLKKHDNNITYEAMLEMEYLDHVIAETLRKYPPVPFLSREASKDYQIPGSKVTVRKGDVVQIPVIGIQRDPDIYPDPMKFNPDRFTEEEKQKRHHYAYLPFGEGPRNCIGSRFGLMQSKLGLIALLSKYKVEVSEKTMIPLIYDPASFLMSPKGGMYLRLKNRSK